MIAIVDYGAGNLRSVAKAVEKLGYSPEVTGDPQKVRNAKAVILPGVGASDSAMTALEERGLVEPLRAVIRDGVPFFGVCLGLQLLLESSEEGSMPCLSVVPGRVKRFPNSVKTPHMGWNEVNFERTTPCWRASRAAPTSTLYTATTPIPRTRAWCWAPPTMLRRFAVSSPAITW